MKMEKEIHFIVNMGVFPVDILVNIGSTDEQVLKNIKKTRYRLCEEEKKELFGGKFDARTVILKNGAVVIIFKKLTPGLLSHEIFHAVFMMMHNLGIIYSQESEETYAYAIQYLTDKIYKINSGRTIKI